MKRQDKKYWDKTQDEQDFDSLCSMDGFYLNRVLGEIESKKNKCCCKCKR